MTKIILTAAILAISLTSCDTDVTSADKDRRAESLSGHNDAERPRSYHLNVDDGGTPEWQYPLLIELSASVVKAPRPGDPGQVEVIVSSPVEDLNYELSLSSPQIDLAYGEPATSSGKTSLSRAGGSAARGTEVRHILDIEVPGPGGYQFNARASTSPSQKHPDAAEVATASVWVHVGEKDSRVIEDIYNFWESDSTNAYLGQVSALPSSQPPSDNVSGSQYSFVRIVYDDPVTDEYLPVPNAKVITSNNSVGDHVSYSDADGYASVACSPPGSRFGFTRITVRTEGSSDVKVWRDPSWVIPYNESTVAWQSIDPPCDYTRWEPIDWEMAPVYAIIQKQAAEFRNYFGQSRSLAEAFILKERSHSNRYRWPSDNILIWNQTARSSSVFRTTTHEYGHAYQKRALGGFESGACGEPHSLNEAVNMSCAFSEGFADFARALAADMFYESFYPGESRNDNVYVFANNSFPTWFEEIVEGDITDPTVVLDGSRVEVAVAAFFYDMYDGPNPIELSDEPLFDNVQYSGPYIASALRECVAHPDENYGIDQTISCIRGFAVPYGGNFFTERGPGQRILYLNEDPGRPSGWNVSDFDKMWRKNIFRIDPVPPNNDPLVSSIVGPSVADAGSDVTYNASVSNSNGTVSYQWETRLINQSTGGGGGVILDGDFLPEFGEWYDSGTGSSHIMEAHSVDYIDLRLTVDDGYTSHVSTKRVTIIDGA